MTIREYYTDTPEKKRRVIDLAYSDADKRNDELGEERKALLSSVFVSGVTWSKTFPDASEHVEEQAANKFGGQVEGQYRDTDLARMAYHEFRRGVKFYKESEDA